MSTESTDSPESGRIPLDPAKRFNLPTRWALFFLGISIMAFAIGITVHAGLGTTTISSIPVVWSAAGGLTLGTTTILVNAILILGQLLLLRSRFKVGMLVQILWAFLFGFLCDVGLLLTAWAETENYLLAWVWVILAVLLMSLGVFLQVLPNVTYLAGEGMVAALVQVFPKIQFGTMKQILDWTMVTIAAVISLATMGELIGVREGTVFAAFFIGYFVKQWRTLYLRSIGR